MKYILTLFRRFFSAVFRIYSIYFILNNLFKPNLIYFNRFFTSYRFISKRIKQTLFVLK